MVKFMKKCAITALVFVLLGMSLAVAASVLLGGRGVSLSELIGAAADGQIKEELEDIKKWGASAGEDVLGELNRVNYDLEDNMIFDDDYSILNGNVEKVLIENLAFSPVRRLEIEAGGCTMVLKPSEDDQFYMEAENAGKIQTYVEGDTLCLKSIHSVGHRTGHHSGYNGSGDWSKCRITLYVPENYTFEEVEVELGAGLLDLGTLTADKMALEAGAGQITGNGISTDKLEIEVGVGSILLDQVQTAKLSGEVGMGNLEISGAVSEKADLECSMGNIFLELEGDQQDFNYDIQGAVGNVTIGDRSYGGIAKEQKINNGALKNIKVECAMGNIEVLFGE